MYTYTCTDINQTQVSIRKFSYICRSLAQLPWTKLLLRSNKGPNTVCKLCFVHLRIAHFLLRTAFIHSAFVQIKIGLRPF